MNMTQEHIRQRETFKGWKNFFVVFDRYFRLGTPIGNQVIQISWVISATLTIDDFRRLGCWQASASWSYEPHSEDLPFFRIVHNAVINKPCYIRIVVRALDNLNETLESQLS